MSSTLKSARTIISVIESLKLTEAEERIKRLEAFVSLCRDGFFVDEKQLRDAADRILKE